MLSAFTRRDPVMSDIIHAHARWRGSGVAAVCPGESLSWAVLDARLSQVANGLIAMGLKPGDAVVLMMGNGAPMLEAIFGVMRAGMVVVPLNLAVPDAGAAAMIADCGAKALIATRDQAMRIDASDGLGPLAAGLQRIGVEAGPGWTDYRTWRDAQAKGLPDVQIDPDAPCNVIYSSGTTGLPKGIVHTHRGRRDWAGDVGLALRYHGGVRTLVTIGMYSNISWVSLLCTLLCGGRLVIAEKFDAAAFWEMVDREGVTHASMVPVAWQRVLDADPGPPAGRSLQHVMSCGSPLWPELKTRLTQRLGPVMIELYGLTEGVITTLDPEDAQDRPASVGRPLIGTDLRLIDEDGREVATGEAGEIVATGRIVMPGYLNRADATQEAGWTAPDGSVWLRTGDIGRRDEEGFLYIVDRKKDMILSGGQNVYPQDIEAVMVTHPAVAEAAVIPARSTRWGETPLGLAVLYEEADPGELLAWCNARLGRQQRLAEILIVDALPRNPNGKILKRELRETYRDRVYG